MHYLNELITRRANDEDQCTGRFWEGRFKSQDLLNEQALLALAYVELNPIRVNICVTLEDSQYTSLTTPPNPLRVLLQVHKSTMRLPFLCRIIWNSQTGQDAVSETTREALLNWIRKNSAQIRTG